MTAQECAIQIGKHAASTRVASSRITNEERAVQFERKKHAAGMQELRRFTGFVHIESPMVA